MSSKLRYRITPAEEMVNATINDLVEAFGIGLSELAAVIGLSEYEVRAKLEGGSGWSIDQLHRVASALNIAPNVLLPVDDRFHER